MSFSFKTSFLKFKKFIIFRGLKKFMDNLCPKNPDFGTCWTFKYLFGDIPKYGKLMYYEDLRKF